MLILLCAAAVEALVALTMATVGPGVPPALLCGVLLTMLLFTSGTTFTSYKRTLADSVFAVIGVSWAISRSGGWAMAIDPIAADAPMLVGMSVTLGLAIGVPLALGFAALIPPLSGAIVDWTPKARGRYARRGSGQRVQKASEPRN